MKSFKIIFDKLFPDVYEFLEEELKDCSSILDLGCGKNSPLRYLRFGSRPFLLGVDAFKPYIKESKKKAIHEDYILVDVRKLEFKPRSFDAIILIELIEHLTKREGFWLIKKMERWAKKKIILTTPNEYLPQGIIDSNIFQRHKSYWSMRDLEKMHFEIKGIGGWKRTSRLLLETKRRARCARARNELIRRLTQKIVSKNPEYAFRFFCVKDKIGGK